MSEDLVPGPFRAGDRAKIHRELRTLAHRVKERGARCDDARITGIEHPPGPRRGARRRPSDGDARGRASVPAWVGDRPPEAPLADEVAIDFPSMSTVVARMREAFFAGAGDGDVVTRRAQLDLTARQADEGVRVPLDLTVGHTCPVCGGRGEIWAGPCGLCAGSGAGMLNHRLHFPVPAGVRDGTRLRYAVSPGDAAETHVEVRVNVHRDGAARHARMS